MDTVSSVADPSFVYISYRLVACSLFFTLPAVRYDPDHFKGLPRQKVASALAAEGIPAVIGYSPLNKEPFTERSLNSRGFRRVFSSERLAKYLRENHLPHNDRLCATAL